MKQWNEDELILFYYQELDQRDSRAIRKALAESSQLQQKYARLCDFLDNQISLEVPQPEGNLNQRIMASVYQQAEQRTKATAKEEPERPGFIERLLASYWYKFAPASLAMMFVVVSVFFIGRWTSQAQQEITVVAAGPGQTAQPAQFDNDESKRVLFSNVSSHLEAGGRLLTLVSNGNGDLPGQVESRRQVIEELVAFNRLYRRVARRSGDTQLANILQQMELILIELSHSEAAPVSDGLSIIKDRLDSSDLIYQLKVTNKKLNQQLIQI